MQNDREFKKYQLQKKFVFWQLGMKITNFANIRRNNSIFTQKKEKKLSVCILKLSVARNHKFY